MASLQQLLRFLNMEEFSFCVHFLSVCQEKQQLLPLAHLTYLCYYSLQQAGHHNKVVYSKEAHL